MRRIPITAYCGVDKDADGLLKRRKAMLKFLSSLFGRKRPNPREITAEFSKFAHENAAQVLTRSRATGESPPGVSHKELLIRFIRETGRSPFVGDHQSKEANNLLLENGIW